MTHLVHTIHTIHLLHAHTPLMQFKEIAGAFEILSDEKKRKLYDETGEEGLKEGSSGSSPIDLSDMFFGDGFSFHQQERTKNIVQSLRVRKDHLEPLVLSFLSF